MIEDRPPIHNLVENYSEGIAGNLGDVILRKNSHQQVNKL